MDLHKHTREGSGEESADDGNNGTTAAAGAAAGATEPTLLLGPTGKPVVKLFVFAEKEDYEWVAQDGQGLTLVHFSAQLKRLLWSRGCEGLFGGCLGVEGGIRGCLGCVFLSETAQVELRKCANVSP